MSAEKMNQPCPEALSHDAGRLLHACGVERSRSWVSRVVRDYLSGSFGHQFPFGRYLLSRVELNAEQRVRASQNPETASFLCYSDPTGETAVRNVMNQPRLVLAVMNHGRTSVPTNLLG